jgi:hypothetical protein
MSFEVAGFQELYKQLRRINEDAPVAAAFGLYEGMQEVMVDAKARAPKDTEAMARSGYVTAPENRAGVEVVIESGFGGDSAEYVVRQHEDLGLNHPNGGEARWFSNALTAGRDLISKAIAKHVNAYLRSGRTTPVPKIVPASPWEDRVGKVP